MLKVITITYISRQKHEKDNNSHPEKYIIASALSLKGISITWEAREDTHPEKTHTTKEI